MKYIEPTNWPIHHFRAMGCATSVRLAIPPEEATALFMRVERLFAQAQRGLSRFDPTSELARLNAHSGEWVRVSPLLWDVLDSALALAAETNGIFDPTLLIALERAGYTRSFDERWESNEEPEIRQGAPPRGRFREIQRHASALEVKLPAGTQLDLGGIAKGHIAQQAVEMLRPWGASLVDAGGDLVAGAAPPGWPGWPVAVANPNEEQAERNLVMLWLAEATLATSGVDYRRWQVGNHTAHHIIDPRTGTPAQSDLLTVTILDPLASHAEAWATATLVLGLAAGAETLCKRGLAALLVETTHQVWMTPALQPHLVKEQAT